MRIDQLIYLVEISRLGSISLAAEHLHISQPTISLAINNLEKELGKKLFVRSRLGTHPTEDGKIIIHKARQIVSILEEIKELTDPNSNQLTGSLIMSAVPGFSISLLPKTFVNYKKKFPRVELELQQGGSFQIAEKVKSEKIDLGFVTIIKPNQFEYDEKLSFKPLAVGKVMACVGKKSPLAEKSSITFKEIIHHPVITLSGYQMYKTILNILKKHGEPNILLNSGNRNMGRQVLAAGLGVGFISSVIIKNDPYFTSQKLVAIPIADAEINLYYGYIRLKNKHFTTAAREFVKMLENDLA